MDTTTPLEPHSEGSATDTSILRGEPEATVLRGRMERVARAGRLTLTMLGGVSGAAGFALWITAGTILGVAIATFGGILLVLGVVQHLIYRRDQAHWPEQAYLWSDGLELVLHNGEVRGASWSDPDFGLQLVARRAAPPIQREYVLIWLMDPKVPPVELSAEGFERVRQRAADSGLDLNQRQRGARADSTQVIHVRPSAATAAAARAKSREASRPE